MSFRNVGSRGWKRFLGLTLGAVVAASSPTAAPAAESEFSQHALQAAYLFRFGAFVEWPQGTFAAPNSPVVLCVQGTDPLGDGLEKSLGGRSIGARALSIRRVKTATSSDGCHMFYVAMSDIKQAQASLDALRGSPVLTVTDADAPGDQGEIVHFVVTENRVRFNIDDQAAAAAGLTISSRLLSLANAVKARK